MKKPPVAHDGYGRVGRRLTRLALVVLAPVAACLAAHAALQGLLEGHRKTDRASLDVVNLRRAVQTYRDRRGVWPSEARWIELLVAAQILEREPLDPWGRPYRYVLERVGEGEARPSVSCLGQDGVAGTADDVGQPSLPERR